MPKLKSKKVIEITPELLMKSFEEAKKGMFEESGPWTIAEYKDCEISIGFITLKNGKKKLVSIKIGD